MPPLNSVRRMLLLLQGGAILAAMLLIAVTISLFVYRTELRAWGGRQQEASDSAASVVGNFIQAARNDLNLAVLFGRDRLKESPAVLQDLLRVNPALLEVVYVDANGQVIASAGREQAVLANLFTIPQSRWYAQARSGHAYLGDVQISAFDRPYLIIAQPSVNGEVAAARLSMDLLWETVAGIHYGQSGGVYVIDQDGAVIAHPDQGLVINRASLRGRPELEAINAAPQFRWSGDYENFAGQRVAAATAPVPGTDWIVVAELPWAEYFEASRTSLALLLGGLLLFGAATLVITARLLNRLFLSPLEALQSGAERIGQGDYDHRIPVERQDEIGQVAAAFNSMAARLSEREVQLTARTQALAAEMVEHQQADQALRQSEERYRELVEQQGEGIVMVDERENFLFTNPAAEELFGVLPGGLLGRNVADFMTEDEFHKVQAQTIHRRQGERGVYELEILRPDGQVRCLLVTATPQLDATGTFTGSMGIFRDITDRREREREQAALAAVGAALRQPTSQGEVLAIILDQLLVLLRADAALAARRDPHTGDTVVELGRGGFEKAIGLRFAPCDSICGRVIATGLAEIAGVDDVDLNVSSGSAGGFHSMACAPLLVNGETVGALGVARSLARQAVSAPFTPAEVRLLTAIADIAANALHRADLQEQTQRQALELEQRRLVSSLRSLTDGLSQTLDLPSVLDHLMDALGQVAAYDRAVVILKLNGELQVAAGRNLKSGDMVGRSLVHPPTAPVLHVLRSLRPLALEGETAPRPPDWDERQPLYAWLGVPLLLHGENALGVICLHRSAPPPFSKHQIELALTLASQAAIAVENARLFTEVQRLAVTDGLTGLTNRRHFFELAEREARRASRNPVPAAVIMLDIDHFKDVNDTYGHSAGDQALQTLAGRFQQVVRATDILARYGGEELVCLLLDTDLPAALHVAERLRAAAADEPIATTAGDVRVTVSIGVAAMRLGEPGAGLGELLYAADTAMYDAKRAGRNRVSTGGVER